jgi:transposase-like protein
MAGNPHPKKRDPESARKQAKEQWANNREKMLAATRKANRIDPPDNAAELIRHGAENGATLEQMSKALGVSPHTLERWRDEHPEIEQALQQGRRVEHDRLVGALFDQAVNKANTTAAIFLLKARHGYVEGVPLVQNSVSVNFTLPGAMSPEQYVKTLTVEAQIVKPEQARQLASDRKVTRALKSELSREAE